VHIQNYQILSTITYPEVPGVALRHLRDLRGQRAENVELRIFQIEPGAMTPVHSHAHAHDVLILHGEGRVRQAGDEQAVREGDVVSIAADEPHSFANHGIEVLEFVCLDWTVAEG
jgi:quercetin dioxygenase-like cupin family protein